MKCAQCPAWGIDQLGFRGCLVDHSIYDLPSGVDGCYMREKTILKKIDDVTANNPRAKYYIWLHASRRQLLRQSWCHKRRKENKDAKAS